MSKQTKSSEKFTVHNHNENVFRLHKTREGEIIYKINERPVPTSVFSHNSVGNGCSLDIVYGKEQTQKIMPDILKAFSGETVSYEVNIQDIVFQTILSPINTNGSVSEALGISYNITNYRKNQIALKEAHEELKQLNHEKDLLFSIIFHDLRGPIGTMARLLDLIATNSEDMDPETSLIIRECSKCADGSAKLLSSFYDWAKCHLNTNTLNPSKFDVISQINSITRLFHSECNQKGIKILSPDNESIFIESDAYYVSTILRNLIRNAMKFSLQGTAIKITVAERDEFVDFSIKDHGVGIAPERIKSIFHVVKNKSTHGTCGEKGSGLGLSLCYQFVKRLGGKIGVESMLGEGSEFKFSIPKRMREE